MSNDDTGGTFHVEFGGVNKTGTMTIPSTGSERVFTNISSGPFTLAAGQQVMRIALDTDPTGSGIGNADWVRLVPTAPLSGRPRSKQIGPIFRTSSTLNFN